MRRGFKAEARRLALEVRLEIGLGAFDRLDPYALAGEYGIPVYRVTELGEDPQAREAAEYYTKTDIVTFSAALVPLGGMRLILDNDAHDVRRRRNSISHEMSHLLLEHEFSSLLLGGDGCRNWDRDQEEEADWLGGELLIPQDAADRAASMNWNDGRVAEAYGVSVPLARMRMNKSGARIKVANRRAYAARRFAS